MNFDNFEAIWGQLWDNLGTTLRQLWGTFGATFGQLGDNFETTLSPVWTWRQRGSKWRSWSPSWERSTSSRSRLASADKTISISIFPTRSSSPRIFFSTLKSGSPLNIDQARPHRLIYRSWQGRGGREGINNLYFDFVVNLSKLKKFCTHCWKRKFTCGSPKWFKKWYESVFVSNCGLKNTKPFRISIKWSCLWIWGHSLYAQVLDII